MVEKQDRRSFIKAAAATSALGARRAPQRGGDERHQSPARRSAAILLRDAQADGAAPRKRALPQAEYPRPQITSQIDYEKWGQITYNTDHALFADTKDRFPIEFFHLGMFFKKAVRMNVVENGEAREVLYDTSYFNMPADLIARQLPPAPASRDFAFRRPRTARSTGRRTTGWRFWARHISARSANCANMACRRAASRSTPGRPDRMKNSLISLKFTSARRPPTASSCMRCSKGRRSSAPIAS